MLMSNFESRIELYFYLNTAAEKDCNERLKTFFRENEFENYELVECPLKSVEFEERLAEKVLSGLK